MQVQVKAKDNNQGQSYEVVIKQRSRSISAHVNYCIFK